VRSPGSTRRVRWDTAGVPAPSPAPVPDLLPITAALRACFLRVGYDADSVLSLLGADAHAAMGRGEAVPARRAARGGGELGTLVRLFLLGDPAGAEEVAAALAPVDLADALATGLLEAHHDDVLGDGVRTALDVRPLDTGTGTRWLVSDLDGDLRPRETDREHVPGLGQASLSLLRAIPTAPVGTVLDLGTGCGVQAVHVAAHAEHVTGTDLSERALALARASCALNELDVELLRGSWFEPVAGRTFDQVVANPPFVVGPPRVQHTYRDSGLDLDGASELVVRGAPDHLVPGGTATVLASWVHLAGQDWRARVASWVPPHGVDAWVVQRDVADPALYVGTWLRDAGLDPRSADGAARSQEWLEHFDRSGVVGIGFGYVTLRRTDEPSDVLCEDLTHGFDDPLGPEALAYLARLEWLRSHDLLGSTFVVAPGTALQRVSVAAASGGWAQVVVRLHRGDGPAWQHETDDLGAALLAGMRAGGLPLGELVALLEVAHDEPEDALLAGAVELVDGLVRHGLVLPAELA
jgi:methylase of polypeptide subunit release factors